MIWSPSYWWASSWGLGLWFGSNPCTLSKVFEASCSCILEFRIISLIFSSNCCPINSRWWGDILKAFRWRRGIRISFRCGVKGHRFIVSSRVARVKQVPLVQVDQSKASLVRPARFERATPAFGGQYSNPLSYGRMAVFYRVLRHE